MLAKLKATARIPPQCVVCVSPQLSKWNSSSKSHSRVDNTRLLHERGICYQKPLPEGSLIPTEEYFGNDHKLAS
ncbi:Major vault protein [Trichinella pseudospiralis]